VVADAEVVGAFSEMLMSKVPSAWELMMWSALELLVRSASVLLVASASVLLVASASELWVPLASEFWVPSTWVLSVLGLLGPYELVRVVGAVGVGALGLSVLAQWMLSVLGPCVQSWLCAPPMLKQWMTLQL
jgi:hypothetical protein